MYAIYMRNYPQTDVNFSDDYELYFNTLSEANKFIKELETRYSDDGWNGHYLYKAKFYAEKMEK